MMQLGRYQNNLLHWKTLELLNKTECYTGDSYTDNNISLGMTLRFKKHELEELKKKDTIDENKSSIDTLTHEITELESKYETEKAQLISNATYEMMPDNTLVHCQLINDGGENIKSDGSFGNELVWCKICDQRCFKYDILYAVQVITNGTLGSKMFSTRASLINWPRPTITPSNLLIDCDKDDSITKPYDNVYNPHDEFESCDICGEKDIDPNDLDYCDLNLAEIGGGYAHEGCMSDEMMRDYRISIGGEVSSDDESDCDCANHCKSNNYENPEDEYTDKLDANKIKQDLENTLLSQGITESQAKLITSGVLGMDEHNLKMADVMAEQGMEEAAKQMFVHPTEGRKMSYSEMRSFYG